ncbi:MAG TPA: hypothetical protein VK582_12320 [Pyrinomonadaceae bacterium]|nr:hypothetical protein [Pyrinomonadaceae bacterium]
MKTLSNIGFRKLLTSEPERATSVGLEPVVKVNFKIKPEPGVIKLTRDNHTLGPDHIYARVLSHRAFNNAVSVLVIIACLVYLWSWEPVKEHLLAWMRWHFWGYPA